MNKEMVEMDTRTVLSEVGDEVVGARLVEFARNGAGFRWTVWVFSPSFKHGAACFLRKSLTDALETYKFHVEGF
jgi:hypothetical protein